MTGWKDMGAFDGYDWSQESQTYKQQNGCREKKAHGYI